jgi:L-glyceraldehyde 3-phosphate reductase
MALAWVLRGSRVTTALIGASRPEQVEDSVGALNNREFSAEELAEIDRYAREADINLWAASAERKGPARK